MSLCIKLLNVWNKKIGANWAKLECPLIGDYTVIHVLQQKPAYNFIRQHKLVSLQ